MADRMLRNYERALSAYAGSKVAEVVGYISSGLGEPTFKLCRVVFEDGRMLDVEGEHDFPYICTSDPAFLAAIEAGEEDEG